MRRRAIGEEFVLKYLSLVALLSFVSGPVLAENKIKPAAKPHVSGKAGESAACPSQDFAAFLRVFSMRADVQRKYTRLPLEYGVVDMDSADIDFKTRAIGTFEDIPQYRPENGAIFPTTAEMEEDRGEGKLEVRIATKKNSASSKNAPPETIITRSDRATASLYLGETNFQVHYRFKRDAGCWFLFGISDRST